MDGDDLPDADYASIYGHEALHARTMARLDALLRQLDAMKQGERPLSRSQQRRLRLQQEPEAPPQP